MNFFNGYRYGISVFIALLASFICSGFSGASDKELVLADHGTTKYEIFVSASATPAERYAAKELATYLGKVAGAKFQIKEVDGLSPDPFVMLGSRMAGAPRSVMEPASKDLLSNGFLIQTKGEDLIITSQSPEGLLFGVYHFLENYLSCRWYSSDFMVIPYRAKVTIPSTFDLQVPRYVHREVFSADADNLEFYVRNRMNGQFGHRAVRQHEQRFGSLSNIRPVGVHELISRSKYGRSHPEFFGEGQLRFGKASVRAKAIEAVHRKLGRWPQEPYFLLISPADIDSYYNEDEDKALIDAGRAPGTAFFDFVRVIADAVREEYPQVTVLALAYTWSRKPPINIKLPINMGIMLANIEVDFSKPLDSAGNRDFLHDLEGWAKLTDSIIIWDYITNFNSYIQPHPNFGVLGKNLKILSQWPQVKGVFEQGSYGTRGGEFAELRAWVLSKLLWNPQQDEKVLIQQFLTGYYGPASQFMADYLALLEKSIQEHPMHLSVKVPPTAAYFSQDFLVQADQIFQKAEHAVRNEVKFLRHVQAARLGIDYVILVNNERFNTAVKKYDRNREDYDTRYTRFKRYLKDAKITSLREGGQQAGMDALIDTLRLPRNSVMPPEACKNRSPGNCIDFQDINFRLAGDARLVPDAMASDGSAVRMAGGSDVWGIQLSLSELPTEGKWKVYFRGRIEEGLGKGNDIAFKAGVYPGLAQEITMNQMVGKGYLELILPGVWTRDRSKYIWMAPTKSNSTKAFYIDRIFAVRANH
ncbi:DUF4838 domain-containing protein [Nitrospira sp. T9]|uniref:DUF4838 domain-containing protein n=1 Tax=unclassified Nitrospira TaxID=2652172 RepID=UPI003F9D3458